MIARAHSIDFTRRVAPARLDRNGGAAPLPPARPLSALHDADVLAHLFSSGFMPVASAWRCRRVCRVWARAIRDASLYTPALALPAERLPLD